MCESIFDNSRKTRTPWGYCHTKYMAVLSRLSPDRWGNHVHDDECQRANPPELTPKHPKQRQTFPVLPTAASAVANFVMDIQDEDLQRYLLSKLFSFPPIHFSQGHSLSVWTTVLPTVNFSKPIYNVHSNNLSLNPPRRNINLQWR